MLLQRSKNVPQCIHFSYRSDESSIIPSISTNEWDYTDKTSKMYRFLVNSFQAALFLRLYHRIRSPLFQFLREKPLNVTERICVGDIFIFTPVFLPLSLYPVAISTYNAKISADSTFVAVFLFWLLSPRNQQQNNHDAICLYNLIVRWWHRIWSAEVERCDVPIIEITRLKLQTWIKFRRKESPTSRCQIAVI